MQLLENKCRAEIVPVEKHAQVSEDNLKLHVEGSSTQLNEEKIENSKDSDENRKDRFSGSCSTTRYPPHDEIKEIDDNKDLVEVAPPQDNPPHDEITEIDDNPPQVHGEGVPLPENEENEDNKDIWNGYICGDKKSLTILLGIILGYMLLGIVAYFLNDRSKVSPLSKLVNGVYFVIVTLTSVGYGDIVPHTTLTKIMTSLYILIGFWMWNILVNHLMDYELEKLRTRLVRWCDNSPYKDFNNQKVRIYITIGVIFSFIIVGAFGAYFLETMSVVDSFYLSIVSISTVGYGDYSFETKAGRVFGCIWILIGTLIVNKAFEYLTGCLYNKMINGNAHKLSSDYSFIIDELVEMNVIEEWTKMNIIQTLENRKEARLTEARLREQTEARLREQTEASLMEADSSNTPLIVFLYSQLIKY
ncbi:hypothetical protein Lal_00031754 [Lupinus albus]|nr:hypothetical protein Lal_00031754 [Lupinus albus]